MADMKNRVGWTSVILLTCLITFLATALVGALIFFIYMIRVSPKVAAISPTPTYFLVSTTTPTSAFTATELPTAIATATRIAIAPTIAPPTVRIIPTPIPPIAPPIAPPVVTADDPNRAATIDGQPHLLPAHSATWYRFDYGADPNTGKRPVMTIRLVNGKDSGVRFEVWAPENLNGWWEKQPTGRGTVIMVDCVTGEPSDTGECQSPDLFWRGAFGAGGTYYVRVVNDNSVPGYYVLTIQ